MKLLRLWISEFKNLKDFEISFDAESSYTVFVGENGSGKSNLVEALVDIFYSLEERKEPPFKYSISYQCRENTVIIDADPFHRRNKLSITLDKTDFKGSITTKRFYEINTLPETRLLPEFVFAYYSGPCERIESIFKSYLRDHRPFDSRDEASGNQFQRFLYGSLTLTDLIVVALWGHALQQKETSSVLDALHINHISDIMISVKPGNRFDHKRDEPKSLGLQGMLREFLAELESAVDRSVFSPDTGIERNKQYHLPQIGLEQLTAFATRKKTNLFYLLLYLREEGVMDHFSCNLRLDHDENVSVENLSEGEKQLLLVIGLIKFSEHREALFLLDEPDTHLNPRWSMKYIGILEKELGRAPLSHILMATHDPLLLIDLEGSQVQLMQRDPETGEISAAPFRFDPKDMGVDGLLTSDLFGLRATIGSELQEMINRRAMLIGKGNKVSKKEKSELQHLSHELDRKGFAKVFDDPIYTKFIAAMGRRPEYMKNVLSPDELKQEEEFANKLLDKLLEPSK